MRIVITSYSIHYTKLYDVGGGVVDGDRLIAGGSQTDREEGTRRAA